MFSALGLAESKDPAGHRSLGSGPVLRCGTLKPKATPLRSPAVSETVCVFRDDLAFANDFRLDLILVGISRVQAVGDEVPLAAGALGEQTVDRHLGLVRHPNGQHAASPAVGSMDVCCLGTGGIDAAGRARRAESDLGVRRPGFAGVSGRSAGFSGGAAAGCGCGGRRWRASAPAAGLGGAGVGVAAGAMRRPSTAAAAGATTVPQPQDADNRSSPACDRRATAGNGSSSNRIVAAGPAAATAAAIGPVVTAATVASGITTAADVGVAPQQSQPPQHDGASPTTSRRSPGRHITTSPKSPRPPRASSSNLHDSFPFS